MSDDEPDRGEITRLLHAWQDGRQEAMDELWPIVYDELKKLAGSVLRGKNRGGRADPTSLVNKAYLRLLGSDVEWNDRRHFFAVAARAMRFVLVDEARRQLSQKRGEGDALPLDALHRDPADPGLRRPEEVLAVHDALKKLAELRPRQEKLVELRYFTGLTVEESAEVLDVTPRTLARDWKAARTWLRSELEAAR